MITESRPRTLAARALNALGPTPLSRHKALWGLALIAPNTLGLFFFFGIPVLMAFSTSVQEWNAIKPPRFVGLDNFARLISDDKFAQALTNTLKLIGLTVPLEVLLALGVAVLLNLPLRGRGLLRTVYFLPVVTSTVAASVVWTSILQPRYGIVSRLLEPVGLGETKWLVEPGLVLIPIAVVAIWQRLGFDMIIFLAGLQSIPAELYEAFDQVYIMTLRTVPGGVGGSATTLTYYLYRRAFTHSEFGYASAIALVLFALILVVTVLQLTIQRYWVYYESEEG